MPSLWPDCPALGSCGRPGSAERGAALAGDAVQGAEPHPAPGAVQGAEPARAPPPFQPQPRGGVGMEADYAAAALGGPLRAELQRCCRRLREAWRRLRDDLTPFKDERYYRCVCV